MSNIEKKILDLGLVLPPELTPPSGIVLPFQFVRITGRRAYISGHLPQNVDGSIAHPLGKVGRDVAIEDAYTLARQTALSILGSLQRTLGDLDRIASWNRVFGMVNSAPGFGMQARVMNGFSELILELFGPTVGAHARSAVGMAELPFNAAVEVEGEVDLY